MHYNGHRYYDPITGRYITPDPIGLAGGINPFVYAENNPIGNIDPLGLYTITDKQQYNPLGAGGGYGAAAVGTAITATALLKTINKWLNEKTEDQGDICENAQAPGQPTEKDGFIPPKKWDGKKVKAPKGKGYGWQDKKGNVWVPTGPEGHGGPHWDVQKKKGGYINVYPGGKVRR